MYNSNEEELPPVGREEAVVINHPHSLIVKVVKDVVLLAADPENWSYSYEAANKYFSMICCNISMKNLDWFVEATQI